MKNLTVFKRYEYKYLITRAQRDAIKGVLCRYMAADPHGRGTISNVYYDTPDCLLIRRSLEKPVYKEKLRVRAYTDGDAFVELKKKYKSVVYKRREAMTAENAGLYLSGQYHPPRTQILDEIDYFLQRYKALTPAMYISYEREAYFSKTDDFRVTFDENILWRKTDLNLQKGPYGNALLAPDTVLMELKLSGGMPLWMTKLLSENRIYITSFSKYGRAYIASAEKGVKTYA